jgi:hypothetical protein
MVNSSGKGGLLQEVRLQSHNTICFIKLYHKELINLSCLILEDKLIVLFKYLHVKSAIFFSEYPVVMDVTLISDRRKIKTSIQNKYIYTTFQKWYFANPNEFF